MRDERPSGGFALIWLVVVLLTLVAFVGLATDVGHAVYVGQKLQNADAVDAAALAGAMWVAGDPERAHAAALTIAAENDAGNRPVLLAANPDNAPGGDVVLGRFDRGSREFTATLDSPNAVKVVARHAANSPNGPHPLLFGAAFGVMDMELQRSAIAMAMTNEGGMGIVLLDPHEPLAIQISGNGSVYVAGPVQVNSNDSEAVHFSGNGTIQALALTIVGGLYNSGSADIQAPIRTGVSPVPDPLAGLPVPLPFDYPVRGTEKTSLGDNTNYVLHPGRYIGGIQISGDSHVLLSPGVYYIDGGGFEFSSKGIVEAYGVMLYNTGSSDVGWDQLQVSGDGTVRWTPPDSGPYAGISIFYDRNIDDKKLEISGNGNMQISGAIYAAGAEVQLSGNGPTDLLGGGFVVRKMQISGDGSFSVGDDSTVPPGGSHVFLVE